MAIIEKRIPISQQQQRGGIGFFGALTLLFIALKLTHYINWSWVWVFAPLWWFPALMLIAAIGLGLWMALDLGIAYASDVLRRLRLGK